MMNPLKFNETLERLKGLQKEAEDFHNKQISELESQGLFDFYVDKITNNKVEIGKGYMSRLKQSYTVYKEDTDTVGQAVSLEFSPELSVVSLLQPYEENEGCYPSMKNYFFFLSSKIIKHAERNRIPNIHILYPSSETGNIVSFIKNLSSYTCIQEEISKKSVLLKLEHSSYSANLVTQDELFDSVQSLLGDYYSVERMNAFVRVVGSNNKIRVLDAPNNQVYIFSEDPGVKGKLKSIYEKTASDNNHKIISLSSDKAKRKEEIDVLSIILFFELIEEKMSIWELSQEVRNQLRHYLKNRFLDIPNLPELYDKSGNTISIHPKLVEYFLSEDWTEVDNYRSKLTLWLDALTVVDANAFGVVAYYDGRLSGLKKESYVLFHYSRTSKFARNDTGYIPVHSSRLEAKKEMERMNEEVIASMNN